MATTIPPTPVTDALPDTGADTTSPRRQGVAALVGLVLVAALLRFHQLGSQFWLDEISALTNSIRRPLVEIATNWGPSSHALFELMSHTSIALFGESPWAARLPAALFGIAGVWAFHLLGTQILGRRQALPVSAFFALSYHHIFYSQNARGYTALIFFFLLASALFSRFLDRGHISRSGALLYVASCVLAAYSQIIGAFIVPAHGLIALTAVLVARNDSPARRRGLLALLGLTMAAALLIVAAYLPFVEHAVQATQANAAQPEEGPRLGIALVVEVLEGLSAALHGPVGVAIAAIVGLMAAIMWLRRRPWALAILVLPVVLQLAALVVLGVGIHPRYLAVALPVVFMIGGYGVLQLVDHLAARLRGTPANRERLRFVLLVLVLLGSALPLRRYYSVPKQDFTGAIAALDSLAGPGDIRAGIQFTARAINGYYRKDLAEVNTLAELQALEQRGSGKVLVVTTLERLIALSDAPLLEHIERQYVRKVTLPGSIGDGAMRIYESSRAAQE